MDSSHGPHSHTHGQTLRLQPSEGDYDGTTVGQTTTTPATTSSASQPIEIIPGNSHNVGSTVSTPGYAYQTPSSAPATKRSNDSKPPSDVTCPFPKRLRVEDSSQVEGSGGPTPISPTSTQPSMSPTSIIPESSSLSNDSNHWSKPLGTRLRRTRSLGSPPPSIRRRRRQEDTSNHLPPVTPGTLRELELHEIYRNPKLRHDVVFDSQLHFRPNLDGARGRSKKESADRYWDQLVIECDEVLGSPRHRPNGKITVMPIKLPILFSTMRDILLTLVPKSDKVDVEAALDPPLLMQQLEHGVLDFKKLSQWLAGVLKAHCAPMRDQWVEQMVAKVAYGVENRKTSALVEGLKMVFGILEAMKLDVANHQIRTLRPHLVSTAISFEQGYFQERIERGKLDIKEPRQWFQTALMEQKATSTSEPLSCFTAAVVDLVTPSRYSKYPATFTFDYERLEGLRDDIREATCLKIAILFFRQLCLSSKRDIDASIIERLRDSILAILGDEEGVTRWLRNSNAVALHMAQAACDFNGNSKLADASMVKMAENWLAKHLQTNSPIYIRVEQGMVKEINTMALRIMKGWASLSSYPILQAADITSSSMELTSIAQRISYIAFLHWQIFRKIYLS
ncbi:Protein SOSEKI 1 [Rhizina undulata]